MKRVGLLLVAIMLIVGIVGLSKVVTITLWTAPNPNQNLFWKTLVPMFEKTHPNIKIKWSQIPATGSSEEAILTAIASNRQPDICTNIFNGFAAELIESNVVVPFDSFPDFNALLKARHMEKVIKGWENNGHYYVIPIYVNPMMIWWRKDLLKANGFNAPPRTYSDVYKLAEKVTIPHRRYAYRPVGGTKWWDRWFDFIMDYYAASNGKPYLDVSRQMTFINDKFGKEVATFFYTMFKKGYATTDYGRDPLENGTVLGSVEGPWHIPYVKQHYPNVYKNIVVTPPLVPDDHSANSPVYTYADTKGLVMFKSCKNKEAAWEFIKWVFSDPSHDALWVKLTNMPPARGDLLSNPLFKPYFKDPIIAAYAKYVPYAVPTAPTSKTVDIQQAMTNDLIEPLEYLKTTPDKALAKTAAEINDILSQ